MILLWHQMATGAAVAQEEYRAQPHWFPELRYSSAILILVIPSSSPSTYCLSSDFLPVPPALATHTSCLPWSGCQESLN